MCAEYKSVKLVPKVVDLAGISRVLNGLPEPGSHVFKDRDIAIVVDAAIGDQPRERVLGPARWGLIPSWMKIPPKFSTFNAKVETASKLPTWRDAVKKRRCLLPLDAYYEWTGEKGHKVKHEIRSPDGEPLFVAGLYSWWREPESDLWKMTATMMTRSPVPELAHIHDRTPMALPDNWWDEWLDPDVVGDQGFLNAASEASVEVAATLVVD